MFVCCLSINMALSYNVQMNLPHYNPRYNYEIYKFHKWIKMIFQLTYFSIFLKTLTINDHTI